MPSSDQPHLPTDTDLEIEDHDRGLAFDLPKVLHRRRALQLLTVGGLATLAACSSGGSDASPATTAAAEGASTTSAGNGTSSTDSPATTGATDGTTAVPEETAGPFPGDGSNGPNVLTESGVVRRDIRTSIGDASGVAEGVETTVVMKLIDVAGDGKPLAGAAVYAWHCTRDGAYSIYDSSVADENFLRGVQESGSDGTVTFTTIFPGAYPGRWPHIHFEVYEDLAAATAASTKLRTSQIAIPKEACETVYATDGYEASKANLAQLSLETDMVFSDGYASQLATASGTPAEGMTLRLNVGV